MDIYLIRHTKTIAQTGLCYGQTDLDVGEDFLFQAALIKQKLPEFENAFLIYSSPLQRCEKLAKYFSTEVLIDKRLRELNFGDWENVFFNDVPAKLLKNWTDDFVTVSPPNGESFEALFHRVDCFWQDLLAKNDGNPIVIFTHAGVIRAMLANVLNLPLERAFQFSVDYGSVHKLEYRMGYTYIHNLNL
ncbi:MAG: alpha-ribazole phosphatase [Methylococcaceae bacterium]|nr:alpha-ribazole phosphatase [Methylococcaceae bacterium]